MDKEEIRRYWQFEIPSTNLFVVEENYDNQPILKFGEYLSDMQCGDTDTKLYIADLKYVKQLQQENKDLKEEIKNLQRIVISKQEDYLIISVGEITKVFKLNDNKKWINEVGDRCDN